jgi:hypothetical protein
LPGPCPGRVAADRIVLLRGLQHPGDQCRLRQVQASRRNAEDTPARRLDSVRTVTEVDDVQIVLQDLLFGQVVFEFDGVPGLAQLAPQGVRGGGPPLSRAEAWVLLEDVADELHGQGRGALGRTTVPVVGDQGAQRSPDIHAAVLIEAGVLGRHDGLPHHRRDLGQGHIMAVLVEERGDQGPAVVGVYPGALRRHRVEQRPGQPGALPAGPVRRGGADERTHRHRGHPGQNSDQHHEAAEPRQRTRRRGRRASGGTRSHPNFPPRRSVPH